MTRFKDRAPTTSKQRGLPEKTMKARPKLLCIAVAVFLQSLCQIGFAADDKMTFAYKQDHFTFKEEQFNGHLDFRFVYAEGPIVPGTAEEVVSFIQSKQVSAGAVVILNSPGGLVSEALELGRAIRAAGFDTEVGAKESVDGGECYSACTLAFLGGVNRTIPEKAIFGVHRFSTDTQLSRIGMALGYCSRVERL